MNTQTIIKRYIGDVFQINNPAGIDDVKWWNINDSIG